MTLLRESAVLIISAYRYASVEILSVGFRQLPSSVFCKPHHCRLVGSFSRTKHVAPNICNVLFLDADLLDHSFFRFVVRFVSDRYFVLEILPKLFGRERVERGQVRDRIRTGALSSTIATSIASGLIFRVARIGRRMFFA